MKTIKTFLPALLASTLLVGCGRKQEAANDIWTAVAEGDIAVVKQYIDSGGDVDAKEPEGGGTPLIVAALLGQTEAARLLIESGADMEIKNTDGSTALTITAFFCHPETLKLLLEKGADASVKNTYGQTALDVASMEWNAQLEQIYQGIGALLQLNLDLERIKSTRPEIARILREHEEP